MALAFGRRIDCEYTLRISNRSSTAMLLNGLPYIRYVYSGGL
jgi:hypothetical protein